MYDDAFVIALQLTKRDLSTPLVALAFGVDGVSKYGITVKYAVCDVRILGIVGVLKVEVTLTL